MAVTDITVGTVANDGTGQTLRAAFQRVNSNYDEFYKDDGATIFARRIDISPAGATPTKLEIEAVVGNTVDHVTGCIFILRDLTNVKTLFCISDQSDFLISSFTVVV